MTVYFQHVGERGGERDFPKTIGTSKAGLKLFQFDEIEPFMPTVKPAEKQRLAGELARLSPSGFQLWGIPSGARAALRSLAVGDFLLLLESVRPGGQFAYGGRVLARLSTESFELSKHLWGDANFPLIVFLKGGFTSYRWQQFCDLLGYSINWNPAGNTYRIPPERLVGSVFASEDALIESMVGSIFPLEERFEDAGGSFSDDALLAVETEEGRSVLRSHLEHERSAKLVRLFKARLSDFSCFVCGFNFEKSYGALGRKFIEAHHLKPVSEMKPGEVTRLDDLVPLCSNCHRMVHRMSPTMSLDRLRDISIDALSPRD